MKKMMLLVLMLASNAVFACSLVTSNTKAKATVPGMDNTAGYLDLTNTSDKDIVITGVESNVAKATELHTMSMKDDKMVMRQIKKIIVPAGQTLEMQGKYHIMFIGLDKPLKAGQIVKIKLLLDNGSSHTVELPVVDVKNMHKHEHKNEDAKKMEHQHHEHHTHE